MESKAEQPLHDAHVRNVTVYPSAGGGWIYTVYFGSKPTIVGHCATRAAAERAASLA